MKGFPNQISDLVKLSDGVQCILNVLGRGGDPRDDGELGLELVRSGVLGTGHVPMPVEEYIADQLTKPLAGQSYRTSARGLRELYRLLGLINDQAAGLIVTGLGREAASYAGRPLGDQETGFWRRVISSFQHFGDDNLASHPYQVLLRLVATRPGITRAKCALALEARDDSPDELDRIANLSDLDEDVIRERIGVSKATWDNAKKVIPRFAEQLGDVVRTGHSYRLAAGPGLADVGGAAPAGAAGAPRRPRGSRPVTATTIGSAGLGDWHELGIPPDIDPEAAAEAIRTRLDRLRRHNQLVRAVAAELGKRGCDLYEDPFDILGVSGNLGILCEVKTLDGSDDDERERVRSALAQLLYYEAFVIPPEAAAVTIHKVACFEGRISREHQRWLNSSGIGAIWVSNGRFVGDALAVRALQPFLGDLAGGGEDT